MLNGHIETTSEFAHAARIFAKEKERHGCKTDGIVAEAIANYLCMGVNDGNIPEYGAQTGVFFTSYLVSYIDDTWDFLRTSDDQLSIGFRKEYQKILGREVPDLPEINERSVDRTLTIHHLASMVENITGDKSLGLQVTSYFRSQDNVLNQQFDRFVRKVYTNGMFEMIEQNASGGMSGVFGKVEVRALDTIGRIMLTFANDEYTDKESSFTFVGSDDDKYGRTFGTQSVYVDIGTAISMINQVIENWPTHEAPDYLERRKALFKENREVCIG